MTAWKQATLFGLLILVIGGITYVTQFLAYQGGVDDKPKSNENPTKLTFVRTKAVWDTDGYVKEYEPFQEGHFDFPFWNDGDVAFELGMKDNGCDCTKVLITLLSTPQWSALKPEKVKPTEPNVVPADAKVEWKPLVVDDRKGLTVPPQSGGVIRLTWLSRKNPGSDLNLTLAIWSQPQGGAERRVTDFKVPLVMAFPVNFTKSNQEKAEKEDVGVLGPKKVVQTEYDLWSATREKLELSVKKDHLPPNVQVQLVPMNAKDAQALEDDLRKKKVNTRVLSAYRLKIRIYEEKDGQPLDLGPFVFQFPLVVDFPMELPVPQVRGRVQGDVEIGAGANTGKINLGLFPSSEGKTETVPLTVQGSAELKVVGIEFGKEGMKAEVTKVLSESSPTQTRWNVKLMVPPDVQLGPFLPETALVLRLQTTPPRQIRIPILGTGALR